MWHLDYPYHHKLWKGRRIPYDRKLGLQYNVCISEFNESNGATMYVSNSHKLHEWPVSQEIRLDRCDAKQMTAPAGYAILYDSRTWHRVCPEKNVSGNIRSVLLNSIVPNLHNIEGFRKATSTM